MAWIYPEAPIRASVDENDGLRTREHLPYVR
jgi:hypothetical protein